MQLQLGPLLKDFCVAKSQMILQNSLSSVLSLSTFKTICLSHSRSRRSFGSLRLESPIEIKRVSSLPLPLSFIINFGYPSLAQSLASIFILETPFVPFRSSSREYQRCRYSYLFLRRRRYVHFDFPPLVS